MSHAKKSMSPAEKDANLRRKQPRTEKRKAANKLANLLHESDNLKFVEEHNIVLQEVKQIAVTKDKEGHRITKLVTRTEKPSQAIRRYWRERAITNSGVNLDPQQANHPGRSTADIRRKAQEAQEAKAKQATLDYLLDLNVS